MIVNNYTLVYISISGIPAWGTRETQVNTQLTFPPFYKEVDGILFEVSLQISIETHKVW